jgi:hypothetical protein
VLRNLITRRRLALLAILAGGLFLYIFVSRGRFLAVPNTIHGLLSRGDCDRACWLGIKPGDTDQATVKAIFLNEGIAYFELSLPEPENGAYQFSLSGRQNVLGMVSFTNGIVNQVLLPLDVCVSRAVEEYGEPAGVQESDNYFYLFYPNDGIVFSVNGDIDTTRISVAYLLRDVVPGFTQKPLSYNWNDFKDKFAGQCDGSAVQLG